jgi:hypothetical protein
VRAPRPPRGLSSGAREVWRSAAPRVHARGHLEPFFRPAFGQLCEAVTHYRTTLRDAKASGVPELRLAAQQWRLLARAYAADFLLLPRARVRAGRLLPSGEDEDLARLFFPLR